MLKLQNIDKSFDGKLALADVSLTVPQGATHALLGSSGSGKTTLLRVMLGLIPFDRGRVEIGGRTLASLRRTEWADQIGYVPQDGGLFPHLTALQNVSFVAKLRGWPRPRVDARVNELQKLVELDQATLGRFPDELSGGQKQRVALMRAAMMDPDVFFLDEPMAALDPILRRSLQEALSSIFRRLGKTVLLVTHDLSEAAYLADRLTLLRQGRVVQTGTYRELVFSPADPFVTQFVNAQRPLSLERSA